MARYNELLVGRYNRFVQKLFSMKGSAALVSVADELRPCVSIFSGAEHRYLESWDILPTGVDQVASAGNVHNFRLRNPAGSNVVAVITKITITKGASDKVQISFDPSLTSTDLTSVSGAPFTYDPRSGRKGTCVFSFQNQASNTALPVSVGYLLLLGNTAYEWIQTPEHEIPLLPGATLQVCDFTVNQETAVSMQWRERFLEESERT